MESRRLMHLSVARSPFSVIPCPILIAQTNSKSDMKILVINCGSSSIKYKLYEMDDKSVLAAGGIEKIGLPGAFLKAKLPDGSSKIIEADVPTHTEGIKLMFDMILSFRMRNNPCLQLDAAHVRFFVERKSMIDRKKEYLEGIQNKEERQLVQSIIHLLEQETMLEFIHLYYRNCIVEPEPVEKNEAIAYKFIYSLHLHVKTERSVTFYANEANLSSSHFTRIVKDKTGKTPSEWIADMTIVNAKLLLEQSGMSIKEIAAELNFPEQFTFRKFFKLHVGVPPKEYRLRNRVK